MSPYQERIRGGKAAGRRPSDFDPKQLRIGTKVELEHTGDAAMAREIAMDHLAEYPDYYRALAKMEHELEREKRLTARALVTNVHGGVLTVVQNGNPGNLLLPGGGVEPGETVAQGAARELREETGLHAVRLEPLIVIEDPSRHTVYFLAAASGSIRPSAEGPVRWCHPVELIDSRRGEHHQAVFDAAGLRY